MGFSFGNLAQVGLGFGQGQAEEEARKQRAQQQLVAFTQQVLQRRQEAQYRAQQLHQQAQAEQARQAMAMAQLGLGRDRLTYDQSHGDAEIKAAQDRAAQAQAQAAAADADRKAGLQIRGLGEYAAGAGTGRYANMTPEQQAAQVSGLNTSAGLSLPVPGAPTGNQRPKDYGLPPVQADAANAAIELYGGDPQTVPETVPYFKPNADQTAKRAATAAGTANKVATTAAIPVKLGETATHHRASEGLTRRGQDILTGDRAAGRDVTVRGQDLSHMDRQAGLAQGAIRLLGGGAGGALKGQPSFKDYQTIIDKNNATKNKILSSMRVWQADPKDAKKGGYVQRAVTPQEQSILDAADYDIKQAQHGQRAVQRGVSPATGQPLNQPAGTGGVSGAASVEGANAGPLARSFFGKLGQRCDGLQCGQAVSDHLAALGSGTSATHLRDAAIRDPSRRVHPDAQGRYPNDTILYFPPTNGRMDSHGTNQHYAVVYTGADGVQRLAESTSSGAPSGGRVFRADRTVSEVAGQHGGVLAFHAPIAAPAHHSQTQPRHQAGGRAGQFKKGKPDISKVQTGDLVKMMAGVLGGK